LSTPLSSTQGQKRKESWENPDAKRQTVDPTSRVRVGVTYHYEHDRAKYNAVFMSQALFKKVFGENESEGSLLKVSNFVYRAYIDTTLSGKNIDVNHVCFSDLKPTLEKVQGGFSTWICPFNATVEYPGIIKTMHLKVHSAGQLNSLSINFEKRLLLQSQLESLIRDEIGFNIFSLGQFLFLKHPIYGPLKVEVRHWELFGYSEINSLYFSKVPYYGQIDLPTQIKLTSASTDLSIVEEVSPEQIERFCFSIQQVTDVSEKVFSFFDHNFSDSWKKGNPPLPLNLSLDVVAQKIKERCEGQYLSLDWKDRFVFDDHWHFQVKLYEVKLHQQSTSQDLTIDSLKNQKVFLFRSPSHIAIKGSPDFLITTEKKDAIVAKELTFEVVNTDIEEEFLPNELLILSVQEVTETFKSGQKALPVNGKWVFSNTRGRFLLKLISAIGDAPAVARNVKALWKMGRATKLNLFAKDHLKVVIVDSLDAHPVKKAKITVSLQDGSAKGVFAMLLGGGDDGSDGKTIVDKEELKILFRQAVPSPRYLFKEQNFEAINGKGKKILFKVEELVPQKALQKKSIYETIYQLSDETELCFEGEKGGDIMIQSKAQAMDFSDINKKLIEFGIGGMSEQFTDVISRTILSRTTYSDHVKALGQKPSRGLLLWGPPGTGKTLLARKLGEVLGVTKERIHIYTGSEIWDKWLGESEKKVRKMFFEARADQKRFGKESPLHLLIIDEIDAFLRSRSDSKNRWEASVVNTFLAELDGISSAGEDSLDNILVVGLTNHPDSLDEAVKRPGRLFPHIHIGIPETKGRKEIFEIHSRFIKEKGFLADDVNVDKIVLNTVGKTGAFIEGLITAACERSFKRLWKNQVPQEQLRDSPLAKVCQQDFEEAFLDCMHQKDREEEKLPLSLETDCQSLAKDLEILDIAGLDQKVLQFFADLKIFQKYKTHLFASKQYFPKGVLLYGPSGVGKTSVAKALKKLFSLEGDRFKYLLASELFPQRGEDLKKKLKKLFQHAKDSAKDLKGEAPLHVVVIDQIDALYYYKRDTDTNDQSVLNKFIAELESLLSGANCHNLLVVGIAKRGIEGIPDGVLTHGRFGVHLEMKGPDLKGRRQILDLYLKNIKLAQGFDRAEILPMTQDRTGSFIQGLVNLAVVQSLRRCNAASLMPDAMDVDDKAFVTVEDFKGAYESMKGDQEWRRLFV
jgi:SpoVK/Ycf46/Vps4 family AAA+-type ATPase